MKHPAFRKIDRLPEETKDEICDNCPNSDSCKQAYTGLFKKKICYEIFKEIEEELDCEYI